MQEWIPTAMVVFGALAYGIWGYLGHKMSKKGETSFEWSKLVKTILPPLLTAYLAVASGQIDITQSSDYLVLAMAGFSFAKVQNKIGWN